jgi:hypothetical protein
MRREKRQRAEEVYAFLPNACIVPFTSLFLIPYLLRKTLFVVGTRKRMRHVCVCVCVCVCVSCVCRVGAHLIIREPIVPY